MNDTDLSLLVPGWSDSNSDMLDLVPTHVDYDGECVSTCEDRMQYLKRVIADPASATCIDPRLATHLAFAVLELCELKQLQGRKYLTEARALNRHRRLLYIISFLDEVIDDERRSMIFTTIIECFVDCLTAKEVRKAMRCVVKKNGKSKTFDFLLGLNLSHDIESKLSLDDVRFESLFETDDDPIITFGDLLFDAIRYERIDIIHSLATIEDLVLGTRNERGDTVCHIMAQSPESPKALEILRILIEYGAEPKFENYCHINAIETMIMLAKAEMLAVLCETRYRVDWSVLDRWMSPENIYGNPREDLIKMVIRVDNPDKGESVVVDHYRARMGIPMAEPTAKDYVMHMGDKLMDKYKEIDADLGTMIVGALNNEMGMIFHGFEEFKYMLTANAFSMRPRYPSIRPFAYTPEPPMISRKEEVSFNIDCTLLLECNGAIADVDNHSRVAIKSHTSPDSFHIPSEMFGKIIARIFDTLSSLESYRHGIKVSMPPTYTDRVRYQISDVNANYCITLVPALEIRMHNVWWCEMELTNGSDTVIRDQWSTNNPFLFCNVGNYDYECLYHVLGCLMRKYGHHHSCIGYANEVFEDLFFCEPQWDKFTELWNEFWTKVPEGQTYPTHISNELELQQMDSADILRELRMLVRSMFGDRFSGVQQPRLKEWVSWMSLEDMALVCTSHPLIVHQHQHHQQQQLSVSDW